LQEKKLSGKDILKKDIDTAGKFGYSADSAARNGRKKLVFEN